MRAFSPRPPSSRAAVAPVHTNDYPMQAYERAMRAFDEYDVCAAEYRLFLDVQRALFASENMDGALESMARGDAIARRAAQCGRHIAPVRETLEDGAYTGPRTVELRRRLDAANVTAMSISSAVVQMNAVCAVQRDAASVELGHARAATQQQARGHAAYGVAARSTLAIDIRH